MKQLTHAGFTCILLRHLTSLSVRIEPHAIASRRHAHGLWMTYLLVLAHYPLISWQAAIDVSVASVRIPLVTDVHREISSMEIPLIMRVDDEC
jgi:hypothetical protein